MDARIGLALLALVWLAGYAVACRWWPYAACRRCGGDGKRRSPTGHSWRTCTRCKGSGERLRLGTRAWHTYRDRLTRGQS